MVHEYKFARLYFLIIIFVLKKIADMADYKNIIRRNPNKRFGKPCVRNTRITVYDVLGWLAAGMDNNEIIKDFPELTIEDIKACLSYAADREHKLQHAS
jgi:uncharacterized protein (DUF433 family)